jgi:hypothetical protein
VTVGAESAALTWHCQRCRHAWPITEGDQQIIERRAATRDRRRVVRKDRRKR